MDKGQKRIKLYVAAMTYSLLKIVYPYLDSMPKYA